MQFLAWCNTSSKSCLGDFADFKFLKSWSRCPCAVATRFGRLFLISLAVMAGHDVKCLLFMALINVDVTGLNKVAPKYYARSLLVLFVWMTPFATCADFIIVDS